MRSWLFFVPVLGVPDCEKYWVEHQKYHGGQFQVTDKARMQIFCTNLEEFEHLSANSTAVFSHRSPFAAYTHDEFFQLANLPVEGRSPRSTQQENTKKDLKNGDSLPDIIPEDDTSKPDVIPDAFDWRSKNGVLSPIQDQGMRDPDAGVSWAFAVIANIESARVAQVEGATLQKLSEQHLLSCQPAMNHAHISLLILARDKMRLVPEKSYPYTPGSIDHMACQSHSKDGLFAIDAFTGVYGSINKIKRVLMQWGPLVTSMSMTAGLRGYTGGIYSAPSIDCDLQCCPEGTTPTDKNNCIAHCSGGGKTPQVHPCDRMHFVNLVGFGSQENKKYWSVRNSWGTTWGESGYLRVAHGAANVDDYPLTARFNNPGPIRCNAHDMSVLASGSDFSCKAVDCIQKLRLENPTKCLTDAFNLSAPCMDCGVEFVKCVYRKCFVTASCHNMYSKSCYRCSERQCGLAARACTGFAQPIDRCKTRDGTLIYHSDQ